LITSLNIVIVSPKAITNVADAEAWFRAVPSGENVMKLAHDWGRTLSICEGHQQYMHLLNHSSTM
jgi:hypothetical protein